MTVTGETLPRFDRGREPCSHFICPQISSGVRGQRPRRLPHDREAGHERDLDRLLRPKSIAVLGAGWALNVIEQCREDGL